MKKCDKNIVKQKTRLKQQYKNENALIYTKEAYSAIKDDLGISEPLESTTYFGSKNFEKEYKID
jgi:phage gpG-like protein